MTSKYPPGLRKWTQSMYAATGSVRDHTVSLATMTSNENSSRSRCCTSAFTNTMSTWNLLALLLALSSISSESSTATTSCPICASMIAAYPAPVPTSRTLSLLLSGRFARNSLRMSSSLSLRDMRVARLYPLDLSSQ